MRRPVSPYTRVFWPTYKADLALPLLRLPTTDHTAEGDDIGRHNGQVEEWLSWTGGPEFRDFERKIRVRDSPSRAASRG